MPQNKKKKRRDPQKKSYSFRELEKKLSIIDVEKLIISNEIINNSNYSNVSKELYK